MFGMTQTATSTPLHKQSEQGDPLMPALFSLGQEPALQAVQAQLQPGEVIYAFLDDIYAVVQPERVRAVHDLLARHLEAHARIRLNQGKARIWNRGGHAPPNIHTLGPDTWVGNREPPPEQQGITVLGAPIGTDAYAQHFLQNTSTSHRPFLEQLPHLQDLQAAWLLLLYTASPRNNYLLRLLPPAQTATFAEQHDLDISRCLTQLLQTDSLPVDALARAHLALAMGGLGLMSASQLSTPAHWASWADAMPVLQRQLPSVAATILQALNNLDEAQPCIQAAQTAHQHIHAHGWEPQLATSARTTAAPNPSRNFHRTNPTRLATPRVSPFPQNSQGRRIQQHRCSQPSLARFPNGTFCQQGFHHNSIYHRHDVS